MGTCFVDVSKRSLSNIPPSYGPSECAVASVCRTSMTAEADPRNIGFPIGCHAWVVDPNNRHRRLPVGCTGELLIEGYIAARGYLHDEEKTSQAFITDVAWAKDRPFRGYLTGDLVFQNADGSFNIVGRKDNQVVCKLLSF
jgi:non-ribosomal peptide synthetase component F